MQLTAPVPGLPIRQGGKWLAETRGERQLEIVERAGSLYVLYVSGDSSAPRTWKELQQLYAVYLSDPIVYVLGDDGSEWFA